MAKPPLAATRGAASRALRGIWGKMKGKRHRSLTRAAGTPRSGAAEGSSLKGVEGRRKGPPQEKMRGGDV